MGIPAHERRLLSFLPEEVVRILFDRVEARVSRAATVRLETPQIGGLTAGNRLQWSVMAHAGEPFAALENGVISLPVGDYRIAWSALAFVRRRKGGGLGLRLQSGNDPVLDVLGLPASTTTLNGKSTAPACASPTFEGFFRFDEPVALETRIVFSQRIEAIDSQASWLTVEKRS